MQHRISFSGAARLIEALADEEAMSLYLIDVLAVLGSELLAPVINGTSATHPDEAADEAHHALALWAANTADDFEAIVSEYLAAGRR